MNVLFGLENHFQDILSDCDGVGCLDRFVGHDVDGVEMCSVRVSARDWCKTHRVHTINTDDGVQAERRHRPETRDTMTPCIKYIVFYKILILPLLLIPNNFGSDRFYKF